MIPNLPDGSFESSGAIQKLDPEIHGIDDKQVSFPNRTSVGRRNSPSPLPFLPIVCRTLPSYRA